MENSICKSLSFDLKLPTIGTEAYNAMGEIIMWAIIGGSGFEKFEEVQKLENLERKTPFGMASSGFKRIKVRTEGGEKECLFLPRHGTEHELLPSEVNYAANIFALKRAGVRKVLAFATVGSLRKEIEPGHMVIPHQYMDFTKSYRINTFCGKGLVGHVSLAHPIWMSAMKEMEERREFFPFAIHTRKSYVCVEGPYFVTQSESYAFRDRGMDVIGMTAYPEFAVAREAGLCYLPCCFVTDYDSWDEKLSHVTLSTVLDVLHKNNKKAFTVLQKVLEWDFSEEKASREGGLRTGLMSSVARLTPDQRAYLEILQR